MISISAGQRSDWWAWEDLNLHPLPYQQSAGNRSADGRYSRSRGTVEVKVKFRGCLRRLVSLRPLFRIRFRVRWVL
jgi:hypothetical protein